LGLVPEGAKQREGDFRTPEGVYYIESKNARSDFFLALKVSYPNENDRARARASGVDPGGQIMIHGLPNVPKYPESRYLGSDWTDGCIAVSNSDMVDLWLMTSVAMPIEIRP
jgi:murein L,D-transpeptidase YafK